MKRKKSILMAALMMAVANLMSCTDAPHRSPHFRQVHSPSYPTSHLKTTDLTPYYII